MRTSLLVFITTCLLISCKQKATHTNNAHTTKSKVEADKPKQNATPVLNDEDALIYEEYFVKVPVSNFDPFKKPQTTISDPAKIEKILEQLFPGKLCSQNITGENVPIIVWKTSSHKTKKMKAFFDDETDEFPLNGEDIANETRFEDSFYYQINNIHYYAFFFSSSDFDGQVGFMRTGRFNCAALGVAVFKQNGNSWVLDFYNPAIGCFGMFGHPHKPHKIALSKNEYGFHISNGIQGAGGPYYGDLYFFKLSENIPQILFVSGTERFNTLFTNWWYNVETQTGVGNENYNLKINIEGYINKDDLEVDEEKDWPKQYVKLVEKGGNYKFNHSQTFIPRTNGTYKLDKETFDYKSWPIDTVNGNTGSKQAWFLDF